MLRKLNFTDKIVIGFLGFNIKKVGLWVNKKRVLSKIERRKIKIKRRRIKLKFENYNFKGSLRDRKLMKEMNKKLKDLRKKEEENVFGLGSFWGFIRFSFWLEVFYLNLGIFSFFKTISHEKAHYRVYRKHRVKPSFGWIKNKHKNKGYYFTPFIAASASDEVHLTSVNAVKNLSNEDKWDLENLEK